jgi:hypothetical protein
MKTMLGLFCYLALWGCETISPEAFSEQEKIEPVGLICHLKNLEVVESSGVAPSRRSSGVYWTHNDSGDGARLFAFDLKGSDLGTFTISGVQAVDWEDIASITLQGKFYLYVGDIGDNARKRSSIYIYRIEEPVATAGKHEVKTYERYELVYPDGAKDCETLLVTSDGDLHLVTKQQDGVSEVYGIPSPRSPGRYSLVKLGVLRFESPLLLNRLITGGDMDMSGRVVLRTYTTAYLFSPDMGEKWFLAKPEPFALTAERQGEAICFDSISPRVITTSEGAPCPVSYALLPKR